MEMVVHSQIGKNKTFISQILDNASLLGQNRIFFILLGFNDNKILLKYFNVFLFCSGRAAQRFIDNDDQTVVSNMASKNNFTLSNFWTEYRENSKY